MSVVIYPGTSVQMYVYEFYSCCTIQSRVVVVIDDMYEGYGLLYEYHIWNRVFLLAQIKSLDKRCPSCCIIMKGYMVTTHTHIYIYTYIYIIANGGDK